MGHEERKVAEVEDEKGMWRNVEMEKARVERRNKAWRQRPCTINEERKKGLFLVVASFSSTFVPTKRQLPPPPTHASRNILCGKRATERGLEHFHLQFTHERDRQGSQQIKIALVSCCMGPDYHVMRASALTLFTFADDAVAAAAAASTLIPVAPSFSFSCSCNLCHAVRWQ